MKIRKPKICHIALADYPGQGNTGVYEYTQNLAKIGFDVTIICAGKRNENYNKNGVNIYKIEMSSTKKNPFNSFKFLLKILGLFSHVVNKKEYRIIHVYNFFGCFFLPLFFRNKKLKWVLDIRSGAVTSKVKSVISKIIFRLEKEFFDKIIFLDQSLARSYGCYKYNIVPLGANFKIFKPKNKNNEIRRKHDLKKSDFVIIHTGSLHPSRNLAIVVYSFEKVYRKYKNIKLIFVGDGEDAQNLKNLTRRLNLENRIIFTGYVNYLKVSDYINLSDLGLSFVPITPQYNFQPPLKTVEYMACGLPTIATYTEGNKVFIKNKFNGLLIKDDINSLSDAISELIENKDIYKKIKENCRKSIRKYDYKKIVKRDLVPIYIKLIEYE